MKGNGRYPARTAIVALTLIAAVAVALSPITARGGGAQTFLADIIISSTIPGNGDLNPYGVALVPPSFPTDGPLAPGDILVSNFNNSNNLQGTGTTIIKFTPNDVVAPAVSAGQAGNATTFFQGSPFPGLPGLGLTLGLGVLQAGVCVGRRSSHDGWDTCPTAGRAIFHRSRRASDLSLALYQPARRSLGPDRR